MLDVKGENFIARLFVDSKTHLPLMLTYMAPQPMQFMRRPDDTPETIRKRFEEMRAKPPQLVENTVYFSRSQEGGRRMLPHRLSRIRRWQADGGDRDQEIQSESHAGSADVREEGQLAGDRGRYRGSRSRYRTCHVGFQVLTRGDRVAGAALDERRRARADHVTLERRSRRGQAAAAQPAPSNARRDLGTLRVTVVDETGAAIVDSPVRIWNPNGVDRTVQTSQRGEAIFGT